jgi:hypothetical protein
MYDQSTKDIRAAASPSAPFSLFSVGASIE